MCGNASNRLRAKAETLVLGRDKRTVLCASERSGKRVVHRDAERFSGKSGVDDDPPAGFHCSGLNIRAMRQGHRCLNIPASG